jgi:hypothetical protein
LNREQHAASGLAPLDAGGTNEDNDAGKTLIRRYDVAPSTQHKHRLTIFVTAADGCNEGILVKTVHDLMSRSTQAQSRKVGKSIHILPAYRKPAGKRWDRDAAMD